MCPSENRATKLACWVNWDTFSSPVENKIGVIAAVYSREISAVNKRFILRHYRAYDGPRPAPIDHNGIDDAILEKASITWYWHDGKWMQLQGAD